MRSTMCAASQLPGRGLTDVDIAPVHVNKKPVMMINSIIRLIFTCKFYLVF